MLMQVGIDLYLGVTKIQTAMSDCFIMHALLRTSKYNGRASKNLRRATCRGLRTLLWQYCYGPFRVLHTKRNEAKMARYNCLQITNYNRQCF